MLDATIKTQLKAYLEKVTQPIEIIASLDDGESSREMQALLADIVGLTDKFSLAESRGDAERKPSFSISRKGGNMGIRFAGLPMGHEFTSLILALLQAGGHPPKVDAQVLDQIRNLEGQWNFETYVSLSCQNCPEVVQALNLMAVVNPNIRHTMIDGALFQQEVEARKIMAVPTVFLNGQLFGQGRMELGEILAKLDTGAAARDADGCAQGAVRRAGRRRRTCGSGGGDLRRAQGHSHRRGRRALRRPGDGHPGYRELHLGQGNRRAEARRRRSKSTSSSTTSTS